MRRLVLALAVALSCVSASAKDTTPPPYAIFQLDPTHYLVQVCYPGRDARFIAPQVQKIKGALYLIVATSCASA